VQALSELDQRAAARRREFWEWVQRVKPKEAHQLRQYVVVYEGESEADAVVRLLEKDLTGLSLELYEEYRLTHRGGGHGEMKEKEGNPQITQIDAERFFNHGCTQMHTDF